MRPARITPGPGQRSVWDFPRPPIVERCGHHLVVWFGGRVIAETRAGVQVLETSHPPTYYFPASDVDTAVLRPTSRRSICEWKGRAILWDVVVDAHRVEAAAWSYPEPTRRAQVLGGHIAFYPSAMDRCLVNGEVARPQEGGFYGGWITSDLVGPFKGGPGSWGW